MGMFGSASAFSVSTVEFAVTWWLQAGILLLTGLIVARLLRSRGAATQSLAYRATLAAILLCPLATQVLSLNGFSLLQIDLKSRLAAVEQSFPVDVAEAVPILVHESVEADGNVPTSPFFNDFSAHGNHVVSPESLSPANGAFPGRLTASTHADQRDLDPAARLTIGLQQLTGTASLVVVVWIVGCLVFLGRLLVDLFCSEALRRRAATCDALADRVCGDVAKQLNVRKPSVLSSPFLNSPCLWGHWRPTVLVPEETEPTDYEQVFLHELAHLRRGDWLWSLIGRLATALLWCQPLTWLLFHRNAAVAEEVCDDYVLQFGGNREGYLRQLVGIAERTLPPSPVAGVAMVGFRSKLGRRAIRILDTSRVLSTRTSRRFACLAAGVALVLTLSVGSVYLSSTQLAQADEVKTASDEMDADVVSASGVVLDPDGQPVAGASVRFANWLIEKNGQIVTLNATTSDRDGRFELSFRKSQIDRNIGQQYQWRNTHLVAHFPGFGPNSVVYRQLKDPSNAKLKLASDDVRIEGTILDLEGQPVTGAIVTPTGIDAPKDGDLHPWMEAITNGEESHLAYQHIDHGIPVLSENIAAVNTDQHGRFRLTNIGGERVVHLTVEGPTIARSRFRVMSRLHEKITRTVGTFNPRKDTVYGAKFSHSVAPTQVIRGVVRDASTKQPVQGVSVESWKFAGTNVVANRVLKTKTSKLGEFELVGMPKGDGNMILANPSEGQPYLMQEVAVPTGVGLEPVNVEVNLHRGVAIRGRVTDNKTGEPVIARIHYLPYLDNEYAQAVPEFGGDQNSHGFQSRYESKADGTYELIGLPGRALVGVEVIGLPYRTGVGADEIPGPAESRFKTYANPVWPSKRWPNTLVAVDVPEDAETHRLALSVDPGQAITICPIDADGNPVSGVFANGLTPHGFNGKQDPSSFDVVAISPEEERVVVLHHEERNIGKVIRLNGKADERQVTLEPCATIKGQLVDADGDPIVGVAINVNVVPRTSFGRELRSTTTDKEGRFEHKSMVPGTKYSLHAEGPQIEFKSVCKDLEIESGSVRNLGTLQLQGDKFVPKEKDELRATFDQDNPMEPLVETVDEKLVTSPTVLVEKTIPVGGKATRHVISGRVFDALGKPQSNANVRVFFAVYESGFNAETGGGATTDQHGQFSLTVTERAHAQAVYVVASHEDLAPDWASMSVGDIRPNIQLRLRKPAGGIRGRLWT